MLFCSQQFLVFFCVVFAVYWLLSRPSWRICWLLAASFYFYASWSQWLALIICVSTLMDYAIARGMDALSSPRWRRTLLLLSLVANLGLLAYFKYVNFFLQSLERSLHAVGASASFPLLEVILPIGISFYTFEAINYTVDVYRRRIPAERNLFHFMLFITFFPHLIAGPIVRARDFLPQLRRPKRFDWLRIQLGLQFFLIGMFKKMVISDRMAVYAEPVFANPHTYAGSAIWMAVLAYALQIYCDFSGYTDMALGTAHMLGYKLARNFNMPYLAANISEFWHRWHISLSTWLRDYLFIPLGGSRGSTWQTARNLMITMALGGLWHGAGWHFVFWGLLHGLFLIVHRFFQRFCEPRPVLRQLLQTPPGTALRIVLTFSCVCVGWVFFRSVDLNVARRILKYLVLPRGELAAPLPWDSLAALAILLLLAGALTQLPRWNKIAYVAYRIPAPAWGVCFAVMATLTLALAAKLDQVFIYFQF